MSIQVPNAISSTARYMAFFRALESAHGRSALFNDRFAPCFLTSGLRAAVVAARFPGVGSLLERFVDKRWPGAWSSGVARTRAIDTWVAEAVGAGAEQFVILGAGFDCRALRLGALAGVPVFEVDRPALLSDKRLRLRRVGAPERSNHIDVPVDFLRDDVGSLLEDAGLQIGARTLFLWEGVTNYLEADAVEAVFDLVRRVGATGSRIIFTYVHADVLKGCFPAPGLAKLFARLAASGESWTFGFQPDELGAYLSKHGLRLLTDLGAAEYRRLAMGPRAEDLVGYEFYRVAVAEVAGAHDA